MIAHKAALLFYGCGTVCQPHRQKYAAFREAADCNWQGDACLIGFASRGMCTSVWPDTPAKAAVQPGKRTRLMNLTKFAPVSAVAALALAVAACGSSDDKAADGPVSLKDVAAAAEDMPSPKAGQYESTVELIELDIPGMPDDAKAQMKAAAGQSMAQKNSFCLSEEEASKGPEQMVQNMANSNCTFERFNVSGGSIDAKMACTGQGGMQGAVELNGTMSSTSSSITMNMLQKGPNGEQMKMKMKVDSKRIGDCA